MSLVESNTMAPAPPFRFLDLPAELRLMIYEHLLDSPEPIYVCGFRPNKDHKATTPHHMAILRVSRLLYTEALPIFYAKTRLGFAFSDDLLRAAIKLSLRQVQIGPDQGALVRHVRIELRAGLACACFQSLVNLVGRACPNMTTLELEIDPDGLIHGHGPTPATRGAREYEAGSEAAFKPIGRIFGNLTSLKRIVIHGLRYPGEGAGL